MAPTRPSKPTKPSNKARKPTTSSSSSSRTKAKSKISRPPPKQQKTKPNLHNPKAGQPRKAKSKSKYTDKQLAIPAVNSITPANAAPSAPSNLNARGKKRKVFVDDEESMRVILGVVQAAKEGDIESKMIKLRKLEEVREARRLEAEKREKTKGREVEKAVEGMKDQKRKRRRADGKEESGRQENKETMRKEDSTKRRKKVAFANG